jgi:excisionase family DNA binding protein
MEKIERISPENTKEAQALENTLRIFARIIARACIKEIASDAQALNELIKELTELFNRTILTQQHSQERPVLTPTEVAEILRVSPATVYKAVRRHEIPHVRIGDRILVPRGALNKMLAEATK